MRFELFCRVAGMALAGRSVASAAKLTMEVDHSVQAAHGVHARLNGLTRLEILVGALQLCRPDRAAKPAFLSPGRQAASHRWFSVQRGIAPRLTGKRP